MKAYFTPLERLMEGPNNNQPFFSGVFDERLHSSLMDAYRTTKGLLREKHSYAIYKVTWYAPL